MRAVNVHEAKTNLSALLAEVEEKGQVVLICRNGKPVAEIVPFIDKPKSIIGALKGSVTLMGDLDEPTDADWEALRE